jgi:hypothetical protein
VKAIVNIPIPVEPPTIKVGNVIVDTTTGKITPIASVP